VPAIRIGISGWTYAPWRGTFFPRDLVQRNELAYAASQVASIEINGTFYSLQRPKSYGTWYQQTPDNFIFSVKAPRFITHIRRLKNCGTALANFFASGVLRLEEKLGPILWQLPPSLRCDLAQLDDFFQRLPRDTEAAVKLGKKHDGKLNHAWLRTTKKRPLRHAMEVRHESFRTPDFVRLLRRHNIALVVADTAGKWPLMEDVTSDFIYVRLHGDEELYVSGYTPAALRSWARTIRAWSKGGDAPAGKLTGTPVKARTAGRDVFVYFDNDVKIRAPYDAMTLAHDLGVGTKPPAPPSTASVTEVPRTRWPSYPTAPQKKRPISRPKIIKASSHA
jgi:uncharacterized protein YecE (DUF72 family)